MVELKEKENEFVNKISQQLCLDSTREQFARETYRALHYLMDGYHKDNTGYQRLLLGRKGVGKTTFLKTMQNIAKDLFGDNLITIYEHYLNPETSKLPSMLITNELTGNVTNMVMSKITNYIPSVLNYNITNNTISSSEKALEKNGKFVFLVLDEIQSLYLTNSYGKSIIGEISEIGGALAGRILCIITGSSYHLRQLCFAKLPVDKKIEFPNYISLDLNSTKFSFRWIYPFLEIEDFEKLVEYFYKKSKKNYYNTDQKRINTEMYLKTGGNARLLSDYIINDKCDSYSVSMRHFQSNQTDPNDMIKYKILEAVYKCTNAYVDKDFISTTEELPTNISAFQTWTKLIKYRIISEKIETDENFEVLPLIYNLADSGHIRYIDDRFETYGLIGLGSPLIYLQLASKGKYEISLDEAVALKSPNTQPNDDIAENITLRFLAKNASKLLQVDSNFRMIDKDVQKIVLKYEYTNILVKEVHANYDQDQIVNRLFKECYENNKDVFGMDGLLLEEDQLNGNELIAHRIQIKLGSSCIEMKMQIK